MKYIFLVAGKGTRLQPLTNNCPKSMFHLDKDTTIIARMINKIKEYDKNADIVLVTGFKHKEFENQLKDVTFVYNPFYSCTNSIASLWFAKEHMLSENLVLINGDVVMEDQLIEDIICKPTKKPIVLLDSSIKNDGDYNVEITGDKVLVMSKELTKYYGEYAGVTKLDKITAEKMYEEIEFMIEEGYYNQWYEDSLVQMIFNNDLSLYYEDISNYKWTEVDCVDDLIFAKNIHMKTN